MTRARNKQKQIWADLDFAKELEKIKAELLIAGKPVNNLGQLTKLLIKTKSFKQVRLELLNKIRKDSIIIKVDKGRN